MNFFKKPDPAEQIRQQNRDLRRAQRDVDKSRNDLERQEKQLELEIKKAAKMGNKQICTIYAKQLIQLRKQKTVLLKNSAKIGAIGAQSKVMNANSKLASAMASTSKTMGQINDQVKVGAIMKSMQDFEKENMKLEMKEEIIEDTMSSVLDNSDDEEEEDAIVNQVLDEIGIEISGKLANAPLASGTVGDKKKVTDSDIEAQLAKLKIKRFMFEISLTTKFDKMTKKSPDQNQLKKNLSLAQEESKDFLIQTMEETNLTFTGVDISAIVSKTSDQIKPGSSIFDSSSTLEPIVGSTSVMSTESAQEAKHVPTHSPVSINDEINLTTLKNEIKEMRTTMNTLNDELKMNTVLLKKIKEEETRKSTHYSDLNKCINSMKKIPEMELEINFNTTELISIKKSINDIKTEMNDIPSKRLDSFFSIASNFIQDEHLRRRKSGNQVNKESSKGKITINQIVAVPESLPPPSPPNIVQNIIPTIDSKHHKKKHEDKKSPKNPK